MQTPWIGRPCTEHSVNSSFPSTPQTYHTAQQLIKYINSEQINQSDSYYKHFPQKSITIWGIVYVCVAEAV